MKKFIATFLLLCGLLSAHAQSYSIDSLQKVLKEISEDTARVFTLLRISVEFYYAQPDSALLFAQQAYDVAKAKQFTFGEGQSLAIIGGLLFETGNYVKALETFLKALEIHEKIKDTSGMAACYNNMAMVYQEQKDFQNAIKYYYKAKVIFEAKKEKAFLVQNLINIGYNYERMDKLDTALFYQLKAYKLGRQIGANADIAVVLANLGEINCKLRNYDNALRNYRSSIPVALQVEDHQTLANATLGIAKVFKETSKIDSSIMYAKQSLAASIGSSFPKGIVNASELLSNLYETQMKTDSAYWYYKKAVTTKDTMFNAETVRKVQILIADEQLRQQEQKTALQRYRSNLRMYILLGGFVILLIVAGFRIRIHQIKREHLIRTKLSKDLHDDLGSTLNSIKVYTNLALIKKEEQHLQKVKESTQEAITGVRDIIWVLDDHKENVTDLVARIRQFAVPLCEANDIRFIQQIDNEASNLKLEQEEKRSLYLIIKEAINNTIKYAKASEVYLTMELYRKGKLCVQIKDNGLGFDLRDPSEGNGLKNMKFRAERIGYDFNIRSEINQGTFIELKKKLS